MAETLEDRVAALEEERRIHRLSDFEERILTLEARTSALEVLIDTTLAKLYSAHEDLAAELEEIAGKGAFPPDWSKHMGRVTELRALHAFEKTIDRLKAVRDMAPLFPSEWRQSVTTPPQVRKDAPRSDGGGRRRTEDGGEQ